MKRQYNAHRNSKYKVSFEETSLEFKFWLAGLIDGEGCFNFSHNSPRIRIVLEERDKFVLDYIFQTIGGNILKRTPQKSWKPHWKTQYEWGITSIDNCLKFCHWILPSLILKKEVCKKMIKILEEFS